ncbi:MAG: cation:proton antiporter [Rhodospirillaceae bacterium]|nr:cation:proton antiporter [Rhodospirillaceae bacterium]
MDLFYVLLILLVVTRAFGELAARVGQPALVGELVSGVVLGTFIAQHSDMVPTLAALESSEVFKAITDLGMFFLMLYAGIEMQPNKILQHSKTSAVVALGGMALPLLMGVVLGYLYLPESYFLTTQALFIGVALAITAVPAPVKILIDLNKLNSESGQVIVSAAVIDDVLSLLLLAWLTALVSVGESQEALEIGVIAIKIALFFAITIIVGFFVFPFGGKFLIKLKEKELDFSAMLIAALAFAVLAEMLHLHFILGSFVAGVFFGRKTVDSKTYESVRSKVSGMTFGFLAPIFFASIGLNLNIAVFGEIPMFLLVLVVVAFIGKFIGAGVSALAVGMPRKEAAAVGVGMSARGAVELVIADIALEAGIFTVPDIQSAILDNLFSAVVVMAIVTTVATPVLLKWIYGK